MHRPATSLGNWNNALEFGLMMTEANAVITMRLWGMAGGWAVTDGENNRMVSEKLDATTKGMIAASTAAFSGKRPDEIMAAAIKPLRSKTRANAKRLAKRGPKLR